MSASGRPVLLLALGNDILGDDAVALVAAQTLAEEYSGVEGLDVRPCAESGLTLLDKMEGYEQVLLVDAITTGAFAPGTVLELTPEAFGRVAAPSPHFTGLSDVLALAARLGIPFPHDIKILAVEIEPQLEVKEGLSPEVRAALPTLLQMAREVLDGWTVRALSPTLG